MATKKYWLLLASGVCLLCMAWMGQKKCCLPGYTKGLLNKEMLIVALELTPDHAGWHRYIVDTGCINQVTGSLEPQEARIKCLQTQILMDLVFIATYTVVFVILVWIIFGSGWKVKAGWILAGMIALFDLLENLFIHFTLKGFENTPDDVKSLSADISRMFNASLSKWTLLMLLVLWLLHRVVHLRGRWFTAGMMVLFGSIILFLLMPVWNLEQPVQVPSVVLLVYLGLLVVVFIAAIWKRQTANTKRT